MGLNLRRLRARLETALLREVADAALLAMGCKSSLAMGWGSAVQAMRAQGVRSGTQVALAREARAGGGQLTNTAGGGDPQSDGLL